MGFYNEINTISHKMRYNEINIISHFRACQESILRSAYQTEKKEISCVTSFLRKSKRKWQSFSHIWLFVTPMYSTVHGLLQARILEWVDFPFSRGSSQPRGQPEQNPSYVSLAQIGPMANDSYKTVRETHSVRGGSKHMLNIYYMERSGKVLSYF